MFKNVGDDYICTIKCDKCNCRTLHRVQINNIVDNQKDTFSVNVECQDCGNESGMVWKEGRLLRVWS